jgi:hypothetical protein
MIPSRIAPPIIPWCPVRRATRDTPDEPDTVTKHMNRERRCADEREDEYQGGRRRSDWSRLSPGRVDNHDTVRLDEGGKPMKVKTNIKAGIRKPIN